MKINTKTVIELTTEELETIRDFISLLDDNESLNLQDTWNIMKSILDQDDEYLNYYGYYLDIK
jgi:hypothetical protein